MHGAYTKVGGKYIIAAAVRIFNDCVRVSGLQDINTKDMHLMWSNHQAGLRGIMGCLDRMLRNAMWNSKVPSLWVESLHTGTNDHSPLVLRWDKFVNWGPIPFKIFNLWRNRPGCREVISNGRNTHVSDSAQYIIVRKLKAIKQGLKVWHGILSPTIERHISEKQNLLEEIQRRIQHTPDCVDLENGENEAIVGLEEALVE